MARPKKISASTEAKPKTPKSPKATKAAAALNATTSNDDAPASNATESTPKASAAPAKRRGRAKSAVSASAPVVKKERKPRAEKDPRTTDNLYNQLSTLLKKKKVSKRNVAERLKMSYQGFLNSFNKRNLKLEAWHEIADFLGTPFSAGFASHKPAMEASDEAESAPAKTAVSTTTSSASSHNMEEILKMRVGNSDEKVAILERQITALENQLQDKQTIITLLREKIK